MGDGALLAMFLVMFFALTGAWNAIKGLVYLALGGGILLLLAIMARPNKPSNKDPPASTGGNM